MSRHSRHNTHLAYFTNHERSQLKYGTQKRRLDQNSYRKFDECHLCITKSIDPVACEQGDIFCRKCVLENLLGQREEIKRLKEEARQLDALAAKEAARLDRDSTALQIADFERVQSGMKSTAVQTDAPKPKSTTTLLIEAAPSTKRPFEVDTDELKRIADSEHAHHKSALIAASTTTKGASSAFWLPEEVPDDQKRDRVKHKTTPICPASEKSSQHSLSLKTLIAVKFEEHEGDHTRICPSCKKELSNVIGGTLLTNCGHVICKVCMDKFARDDARCCKCSRPFTSSSESRKKGVGYIELRQEGTGFSSKKNAVVSKTGPAFQG